MKVSITVFLFSILSFSAGTQPAGSIVRLRPEMFDAEISDIDTLAGIRGKYLMPEMDTLFLINRIGVKEFIRCVSELEQCKQLSEVAGGLATNISAIENGMLSLDKSIEAFREFAGMFQQEQTLKLKELEKDNSVLRENLQTIRFQLEEAQAKLNEARWNSMGSRLLWGTGGFAAGTILMAVLIIIIH